MKRLSRIAVAGICALACGASPAIGSETVKLGDCGKVFLDDLNNASKAAIAARTKENEEQVFPKQPASLQEMSCIDSAFKLPLPLIEVPSIDDILGNIADAACNKVNDVVSSQVQKYSLGNMTYGFDPELVPGVKMSDIVGGKVAGGLSSTSVDTDINQSGSVNVKVGGKSLADGGFDTLLKVK